MNRNFENRKPTKVYAKSKENKAVIKALNMYGRVPETWELLKEIERLNNIINKVREILKFHLSNPSGTKNGWHIDIWNSEDISKLNEDLEILDKENK